MSVGIYIRSMLFCFRRFQSRKGALKHHCDTTVATDKAAFVDMLIVLAWLHQQRVGWVHENHRWNINDTNIFTVLVN